MHFKRLELFGFKSFAEKTVFHFEPGVTAIVGPNGCGKTNVVDSIRWALGEQNPRDLRGASMEDVIFNGTAVLPALGFAEVSLTLSNDDRTLPIDYSEVTVTRRVYRSGESEYLLNKLPVRLKDIQELFMGTGIGTESYSIIGQGKINLILSARPEDRREVFEEASGITRYKTKKREALRKLEETEDNLTRVNDIVVEVQRQLRSIERQAEKARKYQERFERLREAELTAAAIERCQLDAQRAQATTDAQTLETRARELTARWEALRAQLDELTQQRDTQLQALSQHQAARAALRGTLERHTREIQLKTQWRDDLDRQAETLRAECHETQGKLQQLAEQLASTEQQLADVAADVAQHAGRVQAAERQIGVIDQAIQLAQHAVHVAKAGLLDRSATLARAKSELAKLGATAQAHQGRIRRLRADHAELEQQAQQLAQQRDAIAAQAQSLDAEVSLQTQSLASLQTQRQELEQQAHTATEALQAVQQRCASLRTEYELLEQLWQRHEGFSAGVKAALDAQRPGVLGVFVDWLDVQPGYEAAAEAALGESLQALLVDTTPTAFALLQWLRDGRHGRAHVLPVDQAVTPRAAGALELPGAVPASRYITARDGRIAQFLAQQLADVWVVDNVAALLRWPQEPVRLVDRHGNIWAAGCLIGGHAEQAASVVGRRARVEAAQTQLREADGTLAAQAAALTTAKQALAAVAHELEQRAIAMQALKHDQTTHAVQLRQLEDNFGRVTQERTVVAAELVEAEQEYAAVEQSQQQCQAAAAEAEQAARELELQLAAQEAAVAAQARQRETQLVELAGLVAGRDAVMARQQSLTAAITDSHTRRQELEQSLTARQQQIAAASDRAAQFVREIADHQTAMAQVTTEEAALSSTIATVEQQAEAIKQQLTALEPGLRREQDALQQVREQQRESDKVLGDLGYREQSLVERIRDHYQCDVPIHMPAPDDAERLATLKATLAVEREKLESIGPVSLGSISEQEELTQRATFLTTQQQDLMQGQAALKEAIQKINRETRKLFLDTFERIQQEFQYFFKLLFGGGKAELALMDPEDVLDCGIEINASPPGKKLQSITLLSGGEQAMTAVALLFALFKVRPSPFCILDEIDAPLDEANVDRFTRGLGEFTKLSQFIIITHNKKTITRGDVMYGITMEQAGVSKIVSVKFAETKHAAPTDTAAAVAGSSAPVQAS